VHSHIDRALGDDSTFSYTNTTTATSPSRSLRFVSCFDTSIVSCVSSVIVYFSCAKYFVNMDAASMLGSVVGKAWDLKTLIDDVRALLYS
jgi:hypothetical protein